MSSVLDLSYFGRSLTHVRSSCCPDAKWRGEDHLPLHPSCTSSGEFFRRRKPRARATDEAAQLKFGKDIGDRSDCIAFEIWQRHRGPVRLHQTRRAPLPYSCPHEQGRGALGQGGTPDFAPDRCPKIQKSKILHIKNKNNPCQGVLDFRL